MSDRTTRLLRNGLAGDADDYSAFIARMTPLLVAVAQRCGGMLWSRGIAPEDIAQDVWLKCLPRLGELTPREGRMTPVIVKYLSTAVRRRVRDLLLAAANRTAVAQPPHLGELADETIGIVTRVVTAEKDQAVRAAIAALDPLDRSALTLLSIEQVSLAEASNLLGISKDAAKQRHHRARERLRAQLTDSVFEELD
ncbi:MAG: RNA polymerase sigma factor [Planctomycetota bacterium]